MFSALTVHVRFHSICFLLAWHYAPLANGRQMIVNWCTSNAYVNRTITEKTNSNAVVAIFFDIRFLLSAGGMEWSGGTMTRNHSHTKNITKHICFYIIQMNWNYFSFWSEAKGYCLIHFSWIGFYYHFCSCFLGGVFLLGALTCLNVNCGNSFTTFLWMTWQMAMSCEWINNIF